MRSAFVNKVIMDNETIKICSVKGCDNLSMVDRHRYDVIFNARDISIKENVSGLFIPVCSKHEPYSHLIYTP